MSDRAKAGFFASIVAGVGDFILTGGDAVIALALLLFQDGGLLISFVTYLGRLAETVEWLPVAPIDQLVNVVILLVVLGMAYRILTAWYKKWRNA